MPTWIEAPPLLIDGRPVRGSWNIEQEWIDATLEFEADPNWVHIDSHGHPHRWMAGPDPPVPLTDPRRQHATVPTLVAVDDPEPHWCELCQGEYQPWHYECRICGDRVSPKSRHTVGRHYIPGLKSIEFDVEEYLPLGEVMVTVPTDPPQMFPARVVNRSCGSGVNGPWGESHLVPTGPPVEVHDQRGDRG